jgi:hypothetical protein
VFHGGTHAGSNDTLSVNVGTFTFPSDARLTTLNLTVNVADNAAVVFNTTQRLAALNIDGGSATLAPGGNRIISTRALSVSNDGVLDLINNDMVIDYLSVTPVGW